MNANLQPGRPCAGEKLAVIPARGHSKRIPRKNIKQLAGKPLLAYTIEAAVESSLFSRVVVSTDDAEIAATARACGAEVPFCRTRELAGDQVPSSLVTVDALERLDPDSRLYCAVAQLMPTCPLRTAEDVVESYRQFVDTGACSQISVMRYAWFNPWWAVTMDEQHRLEPVHQLDVNTTSQSLPRVYCYCGAVWWAKPDTLRAHRTFHTEDKTGWEIPWLHGVDIDEDQDWEVVEALIRYLRRDA